jgi:hypothetical protein
VVSNALHCGWASKYLDSLEGGAFAGTAAAREGSGRLPDVWGAVLELLELLGVLGEEDSVWSRDQDQARREQSKRRASAEQAQSKSDRGDAA